MVQPQSNKDFTSVADKFYQELYSKADILYCMVSPKSVIQSFNVTVIDTLDVDAAIIQGIPFYNLFIDSEHEKIRTIVDSCLQKGYLREYASFLQRSDGTAVPVKMNGLVVNNSQGEPKGVRFFIRNVEDLNAMMQQRNTALDFLNWSQNDMVSESDVRALLKDMRELLGCHAAGLFMEQSQYGSLYENLWVSEGDNPLFTADDWSQWDYNVWHFLFKHLRMQSNSLNADQKTIAVKSLSKQLPTVPSGQFDSLLLTLLEYESLLLLPIYHNKNQVAGYLVFLTLSPKEWETQDHDFLMSVSVVFRKLVQRKSESQTATKVCFDALKDIRNVGIFSVKNGKIEFVNSWVEPFLGYRPDELIGQELQNLIVSEYHDTFLATSYARENLSVQNNASELAIYRKNGSHLWVSCESYLLHDGSVAHEIWSFSQKTDTQEIQNRLLQAKKMESLGMLASGIVHDFKNLLAGIQGYASLLQEDLSEDSPYFEDVKQISDITERAVHQSARLLAYAEGAAYIVNDLDINQLIKEVASMLSRTIPRTISIRAELDSELKKTRADASQLQQAILQIALNARDALASGGKMIFQTKNVTLGKRDPRIPENGTPGDYIQISINDTGHGIPSDVKEHIFRETFTTRHDDTHFGLGLYIVNDIITKQGGTLSVFSERTKGTIFRVYLPVVASRAILEDVKGKDKLSLGKETILLVEDEAVLRDTARKMLTRYGYKVISAGSSAEALAVYKKNSERIHLVVLDLTMPEMDANLVLGKLKRINPQVKVVLTAGLGEKTALPGGLQQSVAGFIEKPFQARPLLTKVRSALNG